MREKNEWKCIETYIHTDMWELGTVDERRVYFFGEYEESFVFLFDESSIFCLVVTIKKFDEICKICDFVWFECFTPPHSCIMKFQGCMIRE